jgi:hypothetical protein
MNKVSLYNKEIYGEVTTPNVLIDQLFDMLDHDIFTKKGVKWLDPCAGQGVFFTRLFDEMLLSLPNHKNNTYWMTEINTQHVNLLTTHFKQYKFVNIKHIDFLDFKEDNFDIIVANPPFQTGGSIKVPTKKGEKSKDGKEMWSYFVKHAIDLLKDNGILLFITPVIWLKRDHKMHEYILQYKIENMICYNAGEANKLFKGKCQTPIVLFKLIKTPVINKIQNVKMGEIMYKFHISESIPMKHYNTLSKLKKYVETVGCLKVIKTSMRPGRPHQLKVNKEKTDEFPYKNVKTCVLKRIVAANNNNTTTSPILVTEYSNIPCVFNNMKKLILAHKMHGYCYFDEKGEYGISNRDNYVIVDYNEAELKQIHEFLNLKCIIELFDATRYRMRFLERYIFDFIPNISSLPNFPKQITDLQIKTYFDLFI